MFNKRELRVQVAKIPPKVDEAEKAQRRSDEILLIHSIIKDDVKKLAILAGVGYTLKRTFDLGTKIAVIAAKSNIK